MDNKASQYILNQRTSGASDSTIVTQLVAAGWGKQAAEQAVAKSLQVSKKPQLVEKTNSYISKNTIGRTVLVLLMLISGVYYIQIGIRVLIKAIRWKGSSVFGTYFDHNWPYIVTSILLGALLIFFGYKIYRFSKTGLNMFVGLVLYYLVTRIVYYQAVFNSSIKIWGLETVIVICVEVLLGACLIYTYAKERKTFS